MAGTLQRLVEAYRRTGADVPFGDPLPSHHTEMEGWFWRATEPSSGRAIVALCSVNRHPAGDWSTVAVALHPGGIVRAAALDGAVAADSPFTVSAGSGASAFTAGSDRVDFRLGDLHLRMEFSDPFVWPKAFAGGGIFSSIPFLNQYWHPYRLGGRATGSVEFDGQRWDFTDATLYAERNWGRDSRCDGGGARHTTSTAPTSRSRSPADCSSSARCGTTWPGWWSGWAER